MAESESNHHHHHHYYHPDYDHYDDDISNDKESSDDDDDEQAYYDDVEEAYYEDVYSPVDDDIEQPTDTSDSATSTDETDNYTSERVSVDEEGELESEQTQRSNTTTNDDEDDDEEAIDIISSSTESEAQSEVSDVEEDTGSTPTGTWTIEEQTRGHLSSTSRVPPRVSPVTMTDDYRAQFFELANLHLSYQASVREPDFAKTLYDIAEYYGFVRGKWLLFTPANVADMVWDVICSANARGELGGYCECSLYDPATDTFRIAVFCNNFTELDDCINVLEVLRVLLAPFMVQVATFKPEFLTALGVYKKRRGNHRAAQCRFTFAELAIEDSWLLPELKHALGITRYRGNRTRKNRGGRRRRRKQGKGTKPRTPYWYDRPNPFQNNKVYRPTRPNSRWTAREKQERQLVHYSDFAPFASHRSPRDMDSFLRTAQHKLDKWVQTRPVDRAHRRRFMARLYALAAANDYTIGKWKVFAPARVADEVWAAVCRANKQGRLGGCIKICEYNPRSGSYLICVYVNDFTNVDECTRVLHELDRVCSRFGVFVTANFKADFLTKLGVYHSRNGRTSVQYTFGDLHVARDWPYAPLKAALNEVKRERRAAL